MSSTRLRRAKSADRVTSERSRRDYGDLGSAAAGCGKCDLVGFPYCCTAHYNSYRRWPYYLDPLDYPYSSASYYRYRPRYWADWPYYEHYSRRPWYSYEDDYYRDYMRGYAEGLRKYDSQRKLATIGVSSGDLAAPAPSYLDKHPHWWYQRPYYYRRYL